MEKKLTMFAMSALLLCASVTMAQRAAQAAGGGGQSSGLQMASRADAFASLNLSPLQNMVVDMIIGRQEEVLNHKLAKVPSSEMNRARGEVVISCNYYIRAALTKDQQRLFDKNVLQLEKIPAPAGWQRVLTSPTLLDTLIESSPEQGRKITELREKVSAMDDRVISDIVSLPTPAERKSAGEKRFHANRAYLDKEFRALLTKVQLKELDNYLKSYNDELARLEGDGPPNG